MGRLNRTTGYIFGFLRTWGLPAILVLIIFAFFDSQILANPAPSKSELQAYLEEEKKLEIGTQTEDGYQQVYYVYNDIKIFVTKNQRNHTQPVTSGKYVAWVETIEGFPQIILYDLLEKTRLQITQTGTNVNPAIYKDQVVWEGLERGVQQIFYFGDEGLKQISSGDNVALRPKIKGQNIIYSQYTDDSQKPWQVISYDLTKDPNLEDPREVVKEGGESDSWPSFDGEEIKTSLE